MEQDAAQRMASELGLTPAKLQHLRQVSFHQAVQDLENLKAEAKRNYKRLALKYHPDQNQGRQEEAAQEFILLGQVLKKIEDLHVIAPPTVEAQSAPVIEDEELGAPPPTTTYFQWQTAGMFRHYDARKVVFIRG